MKLKDVLKVFDEEINEHIESIEYYESDSEYLIEIAVYENPDEEGNYENVDIVDIGLYNDGETSVKFKIIENNCFENRLLVSNETMKIINKICNVWKAYITSLPSVIKKS